MLIARAVRRKKVVNKPLMILAKSGRNGAGDEMCHCLHGRRFGSGISSTSCESHRDQFIFRGRKNQNLLFQRFTLASVARQSNSRRAPGV